MKTYVLITAARNEEMHLDQTIQSVVNQTIRPVGWVVVSDGSTDRTESIVEQQAGLNRFIKLVRRRPEGSRNFASKAAAINEGYRQREGSEHGYVGILDADVTLPPTYYAAVMEKMEAEPDLGIAGGSLFDPRGQGFARKRNSASWSVCGPIQMFRRECFERIGGYFPSRVGGVDAIAEVMARMNGWRVRTFTDLAAYHQRRTGTQGQSQARALFRLGVQNYMLGYHPLFMLTRFARRATERPWLVGGLLILGGYTWAGLQRPARQVPPEFVRYLRNEQLGRLWPTRRRP